MFPAGPCLPGITRLFVDTDGNFHLCEKISWKFSVGNVNDGYNVDSIYHLIDEYFKSANDCRDCWAFRLCGDCFISAIKKDGFSKERKQINCIARRKRLKKLMRDYVNILESKTNSFKQTDEENDIPILALKLLGRC